MGALLFVLGVLTWTLLEYAVHRWLFHGPLWKHHQHHHKSPLIPHPIPLWALMPPLLLLALLSVALALGVLVGLTVYEAVHVHLHHGKPKALWLLRLRAHHLKHHHFGSYNYGVTGWAWDKFFGTNAD